MTEVGFVNAGVSQWARYSSEAECRGCGLAESRTRVSGIESEVERLGSLRCPLSKMKWVQCGPGDFTGDPPSLRRFDESLLARTWCYWFFFGGGGCFRGFAIVNVMIAISD